MILSSVLSLPPREDEFHAYPYQTAGVLAKAGVTFAFSSGGFQFSRDVPFQAGRAVAWGLSHDGAIKALTLDAARDLGVDSQVGSIEAGKVANLVVIQRRSPGDSIADSARDHRRPRHPARQLAGRVVQEVHVPLRRRTMTSRLSRLARSLVAIAATAGLPFASASPRRCRSRAPRYAITNARIVTAAGPAIEKGTARDARRRHRGRRRRPWPRRRMRVVVDGTGLVVYPGLIDMSNNVDRRGRAPSLAPAAGGAAAAAGRRSRRRGRGHARRHHVGRPGARGADAVPPSGRRGVEDRRDRGGRRAAARGGRHHVGARGPGAGHHPGTERARQPHGAARSERDQRPRDVSPRRRRREVADRAARRVCDRAGRR